MQYIVNDPSLLIFSLINLLMAKYTNENEALKIDKEPYKIKLRRLRIQTTNTWLLSSSWCNKCIEFDYRIYNLQVCTKVKLANYVKLGLSMTSATEQKGNVAQPILNNLRSLVVWQWDLSRRCVTKDIWTHCTGEWESTMTLPNLLNTVLVPLLIILIVHRLLERPPEALTSLPKSDLGNGDSDFPTFP